MNRILIVSPTQESAAAIEQLLRCENSARITAVSSGSEARRFIHTAPELSLAVISTPLPDEFGSDIAVMISEEYQTGVILICGNDIAGDIADNVCESGIYVVSRPVSREVFSEAVQLASVSHGELAGLKRENADVMMKIEEIRLINRAKATLMKYLKFTEPQAHRYIEKQAMNSRQTRRETALHILADYGMN